MSPNHYIHVPPITGCSIKTGVMNWQTDRQVINIIHPATSCMGYNILHNFKQTFCKHQWPIFKHMQLDFRFSTLITPNILHGEIILKISNKMWRNNIRIKSQEAYLTDFKVLLLFFKQMWTKENCDKNLAFTILYYCEIWYKINLKCIADSKTRIK